MGTIRAVIVDDERYAREELSFLLSNYPSIQIIGEADTGEDAIMKAIQLQPDVLFLDIEMPKMNGVDVAKSCKELKKPPLIVFATAYPQFAADAFRINAVDYLLKPYAAAQLDETIKRLKPLLCDTSRNETTVNLGKLAVEMDGEIDYVSIDDILYIYRDVRVTKLVTVQKEYEVRMTLKELESRLLSFSFFRIHKGYIVNLSYVTRLTPWFNGAYQLELQGVDTKLSVSRNYVRDLRQRLEI